MKGVKNFNDTIGNRTRYLQTGGTVPQPAARPRAPLTALQFQSLHSLQISALFLQNICAFLPHSCPLLAHSIRLSFTTLVTFG